MSAIGHHRMARSLLRSAHTFTQKRSGAMDSVTAFRSRLRSDAALAAPNLSRGLGWFSVALGVTELAIPRTLARFIGVEPGPATSWLVRAMGVRELIAGIGVLMQPRRPLPLWSRVAGDAIDLALIGSATTGRGNSLPRLVGAAAAVAGVTALDVVAARRNQRAYDEANRPAIYSVTINKPPAEVYAFYRKLSQLPMFMDYLESVRETEGKVSHWVARLPIGGTISWDARITEDRPGELIAWQSVEGSLIQTSGRVSFSKTPGRNMTEVRVEMQLGFLGTKPSTSVAKFFARPQIKGDLRRLKQVLETGEVLFSDASVHRGKHAAQPSPAGKPGSKLAQQRMPFVPHQPTADKGAVR
jgi:uncharacterized membrane protein